MTVSNAKKVSCHWDVEAIPPAGEFRCSYTSPEDYQNEIFWIIFRSAGNLPAIMYPTLVKMLWPTNIKGYHEHRCIVASDALQQKIGTSDVGDFDRKVSHN